ncbi:hypothetical protein GCM10007866_12150 [Gluconobacter albidus]|uniref:Uncharacterized protein n=1 Tax=Gluconobacter albidus TaxID=318683 RepID=A0ABQ5WZ64_9PROT|nr:hypothetical protein AA3250_0697 [Gluconobacter albidus NBRC 3250]GLQ68764.1 hypothetical protein GCM10007866_12150 [Gluconobacter albidus]
MTGGMGCDGAVTFIWVTFPAGLKVGKVGRTRCEDADPVLDVEEVPVAFWVPTLWAMTQDGRKVARQKAAWRWTRDKPLIPWKSRLASQR